jgi:ribosomal protein S27E
MNAGANNCPNCGELVEAESTGGHAVGTQPIHQHATCSECGAKLVRNVGDVWREDESS